MIDLLEMGKISVNLLIELSIHVSISSVTNIKPIITGVDTSTLQKEGFKSNN